MRAIASSSAFVGCSSAAAGAGHRRRLATGMGRFAVRDVGPGVVEVPVGQPVPDDLEGQEVLTLLAEHPAQALDVVLEELAVPRG